MGLKRYETVINGVKTVLQLNAEDAERYGDAVTEVKKTKSKAAAAPQNKAAAAASTTASAPVTAAAAAADTSATSANK